MQKFAVRYQKYWILVCYTGKRNIQTITLIDQTAIDQLGLPESRVYQKFKQVPGRFIGKKNFKSKIKQLIFTSEEAKRITLNDSYKFISYGQILFLNQPGFPEVPQNVLPDNCIKLHRLKKNAIRPNLS